ncbi:hypothetical protein T4D_8030 [Trichinella pseudospiralis]|uniref:Uncharacterized protein n=1 Tax=Trichinella pseudospiralis TaxID=6337 RepID=A0A0V1FY89_TRIPS|nr:hypothetical protein T4D_8030 [Trichinella pseudospiralis]
MKLFCGIYCSVQLSSHFNQTFTGTAADFHYFQLYISVFDIARNTLQLLYSVPGPGGAIAVRSSCLCVVHFHHLHNAEE